MDLASWDFNNLAQKLKIEEFKLGIVWTRDTKDSLRIKFE